MKKITEKKYLKIGHKNKYKKIKRTLRQNQYINHKKSICHRVGMSLQSTQGLQSQDDNIKSSDLYHTQSQYNEQTERGGSRKMNINIKKIIHKKRKTKKLNYTVHKKPVSIIRYDVIIVKKLSIKYIIKQQSLQITTTNISRNTEYSRHKAVVIVDQSIKNNKKNKS